MHKDHISIGAAEMRHWDILARGHLYHQRQYSHQSTDEALMQSHGPLRKLSADELEVFAHSLHSGRRIEYLHPLQQDQIYLYSQDLVRN